MKFPQVEEAEVARRPTHRAHPRGKEQIAIEIASTVESTRPPRPRGKGEVVIAKIET